MTSPEALRYSQSHSYNELLKDMLMSKSLPHDKNTPQIYSLEEALKISIRIATEKGDIVTSKKEYRSSAQITRIS